MCYFSSLIETDDEVFLFKLIITIRDGIIFGNPLYTFYSDKFINVSVTHVNNDNIDDLPSTGKKRATNMR